MAQSEFAWHWEAIPDVLAPAFAYGLDLISMCISGWWSRRPRVTRATGRLVQVRAEASQLRAQLQALQLTHATEHASLLEHQKAFGEARTADCAV
ncbi:type 11 methyltransferase [Alicycliphilus sp. B1]|nr:type 11 methyltransferase [Alicycliphilus sp. B1]